MWSGTRACLMAVVAVAAIPVISLMGYDFVRDYRNATHNAQDELARFVDTVAVTNLSIVSGSRAVLVSLLERSSVANHDESICSSEFEYFLSRTSGYLNTGIAERDGILSCSGIPFTPGAINLSDRDWFQEALASHTLTLGGYQVGHATGKPSINLALAEQRPDGTTAIAFLALDLDWLSRTILRRVDQPPLTNMVLTDRSGTVLARWPETANSTGKSLAGSPLFTAMREGQPEVINITNPDGAESLAAIAPVPVGSSPALFLAVTVPLDVVTADALSNLKLNLGGFAIGSILVLSLAWFLAERLVRRPLARIAEVAGRFATGEAGARVGAVTGTHEIKAVADAFDRMADSLGERSSRLIEAHESLRKAHGTLNAVVNASPSAIICLDATANVTLWNPAAERLFGWKSGEILGQPHPVVPESEQLNFREYFERAMQGESIVHGSGVRVARDGKEIHVSFNSAPLYDERAEQTGVLYVVNDVTRRLQIERELHQAQKMEAVGQLTGGLAHDLNNLLAVVIGNLDLLAERLEGDEQACEDVQSALGASLRGAELTRQLLAFSRRQPLQPKRIDVNDLVSNLSGILKRTLGENVVVETKLVANPWPAIVDPSQVESALMNMAINARDAMPKGGRLIIETDNKTLDADYVALNPEAIPGDYVMLSVSDTGTGIPADILQKVFEPFFTTKPAGRGTGLGLSMIYGFVKQSGGHVKIYSEVGVGTTIRLYLPKAGTETEIDADESIEETPLIGRGETVLVVEDKTDVRRIVCRQLTTLGYNVLDAEDANAALHVLRSTKPIDLLFTDVVMPGDLSGPDLAREALTIRPKLKVLFTSGFPETARNGGKFAATDLLISKPYRHQDLAKKLREALTGKE